MHQIRVIVKHIDEMPADLPAVWTDERDGCGRTVLLYLRADLPQAVGDHFRAMACRDAMPDSNFDGFTVTSAPIQVAAVA